jgi:hypothetical protein
LVGIGDADDLDVVAVQVVLEESFNVAMDQADDGDAHRGRVRLADGQTRGQYGNSENREKAVHG